MAKPPDRSDDRDRGFLLGPSIRRNFWEYVRRPFDEWTEFGARELIAHYVQDGSTGHSLRKKLRDYPKTVEENGQERQVAFNEDEVFMRELRDTLESQYEELVRSMDDPLARAGILASTRDSWYKPWPAFRPEFWTSWLEPGADAYIIGIKGSGKTDMACKIAEYAIEQGYLALTNIPMKEKAEDVIYCPRASVLIEVAIQLRMEGKNVLFLSDEGVFSQMGETPLKPEVMAWRMLSRLFRKFRIAQVVITQYHQDVLGEVKRTATLKIRKESRSKKDRGHVDLKGLLGGRSVEFHDFVKWIPPTELPFDTHGIAAFQMDVDVEELFKFLSLLEEGEDQFEAAAGWLGKQVIHFTRSQKAEIARWANREEHIPQRRIAKFLGVSQGTISAWVKHREELVD